MTTVQMYIYCKVFFFGQEDAGRIASLAISIAICKAGAAESEVNLISLKNEKFQGPKTTNVSNLKHLMD